MPEPSLKRRISNLALIGLERYGQCDLFLIGLTEVGIISGKEWWWDCPLFQIGLCELGLP